MRILILCTGNTCRSPMAEALLREMLRARLSVSEAARFRVVSAGLRASYGSPAAANAIKVMAEQGVELAAHQSQSVSSDLVAEADLILVMTADHRNLLLMHHPEAARKTFTLKSYAYDGNPDSNHGDIDDPYGFDLGVYRDSVAELQRHLKLVVDRLLASHRNSGH